ncbi:MAG: dTDP-glucose 4,6-dehydratase [Candidatus Komeilibacteria bacterium CG_4_10_14_0_2_um_filter_37_10]|uniref:dTDP-glucose 4,6-dehydratase n=1 Tax=Candidatus Komeilibacteria bacterium CG_4_10_14_0_2_um_filter_37_10 TaxID=1974470 RepID=A0A2M7VEV1_9BACT|nr:MAG: dTDP-glucose 4,6-dehydratase [Candidatus Komeilibacteria bacterium CG_4_10_14_0_2_um_filter_37_10]PJA92550.1 MAG: dTDP-glucose 4,6-dehydratase [Candidatus Komeilibacteria bacterium CG_4_9_14_3_um_filter_37_5]
MKLLITGGAGFGGTNFIKYILAKYPAWQITNLDKLTYAGNLNNLQDITDNPNYHFVRGDIADAEIVNKLLPNIDIVINYAAETHVDRSILDPDAFMQSNIIGTYTLLEGLKKNPVQRFIQISTDEVFGSITTGEFSEESPFKPNSPYAAAKASADLLCRAYYQTYQLPIIITHSCNYYGPYQYPEKLIPLLITNLLADQKIPIYGQGDNIREWIHTNDHASAIATIIEKGQVGETYNIGTGDRCDNLTMAKLILQLLNKDESYINYIADRPGHDWRYAINNDKIKALGWQPQIELTPGITNLIQWYQDNKWWWQPIKSGEYLNYYNQQYGNKK